jgi:uroporphyrinogen-III synthase
LACGWPAARVDAPGAQASSLDSEALWAQVSAQAHPGVRVLIVRGTQDDAEADAAGAGVGRDWLAQALRQAGAQVDFLAAYARGLPRWSAAQQASAAQAVGREHLWLFSSVQAVQHLAQLLPDQRWAGTPAVATHARIAQAAQDLGFTPVRLARPSLSEVMASIESLA